MPLACKASALPYELQPHCLNIDLFFISTKLINFFECSKIKNGGAGNRTPCLSHAKRALYHMSYTPDVLFGCIKLLKILS